MTSFLSENEAENIQNLAQIPDLERDISRTIWRIDVGDGLFFCIFHAFPFKLNFFFDQSFPLS